MKKVAGVWLPDTEEHLIPYLENPATQINGIGTYQKHKAKFALNWTKNRRVAVDVGAHCGLWSMHLVQGFQTVLAFEPLPDHRACFLRNVQDEVGADNFTLHANALGDQVGTIRIKTKADSSGDAHVDPVGDHEVFIRRFDDLYPDLWGVDFVKLDCEGYELFALRGMQKMIERCKPCVIVEQKPNKAQKYGLEETQAVTWLQSLGATLRMSLGGDFVLSWQ